MIIGTSGQNAFAITTYPTSKLVYDTESLSVADSVLTKLHAVILLSLVIVAVRLPVSEVKAFIPLNPKIKIWILICCPHSFPTEVVGRSW